MSIWLLCGSQASLSRAILRCSPPPSRPSRGEVGRGMGEMHRIPIPTLALPWKEAEARLRQNVGHSRLPLSKIVAGVRPAGHGYGYCDSSEEPGKRGGRARRSCAYVADMGEEGVRFSTVARVAGGERELASVSAGSVSPHAAGGGDGLQKNAGGGMSWCSSSTGRRTPAACPSRQVDWRADSSEEAQSRFANTGAVCAFSGRTTTVILRLAPS